MPKSHKNSILKLRRTISRTPCLSFIPMTYRKLLKLKSYKVYTAPRKPVSLSKKTIHDYNKTRTAHNYKYLCHAPFTNLYFSYGGKIGVCCYNRDNIFGNWPSTSISDAWNSEQMKDLRNKMQKCDLSAGCYCCQVQWEEKAYTTVLARNYDYFQPAGDYPVSMEFELSNRCNLECIMCSEENSSKIAKNKLGQEEKILPYNDEFVEELREFIPHLKSTKFMGGEPFLIPVYYKIWDLIIELNPACEIVVQTNGTILNDKIKDLLEKGNFSISVSIDSIKKETYEQIRKGAKFEEVMNNLNYFIDFCQQKNRFIGIACCFIQQNWNEIPDFINHFNKLQIPLTFNRVWSPPNCSIWESSYEITSKILEYYKTIKFNPKTQIEHRNTEAFKDLINLVESWNEHEKLKLKELNKFTDIPIDELEKKVQNHIFLLVSGENLDIEKQKIIQTKLENTIYTFRDNKGYRELLIKAMNIPAEILHTQILNSTEEKLMEQLRELKQSGEIE